mmetsp:Transcript_22554/g.39989  ORF Transcript_22554/g.39989 Transcript_22554/m.39989 type:complete len:142 (-) Transcript_22554:483-908(-)|eukprot:CAMPEP_0175041574 /NCGR_PEP_ID=MMETSP0052_2-20121109/1998_1 /TAXON_ID=51329 ORGANISM="Polytomella parva, Strain SAG 63-3" /NCGR_SAMPLE_ID=MMETSP0052_2 /ASSEMBLY_ACC=CAM_ASM_000194 /LENGTH=141 /DNA_ID=CAMNT_0016304119 /DNA_START=35 /DNA_END=460 /DNA_ORIENTATION=+
MSETLPVVPDEVVAQVKTEYLNLINSNGISEEVKLARFRLVWTLVHAESKKYVKQGLELCEGSKDFDYLYFNAVALYKLKEYSKARKVTNELSKLKPNHHQTMFLSTLIEKGMIEQGLVGIAVSVGMGLAAVGAALFINRK